MANENKDQSVLSHIDQLVKCTISVTLTVGPLM
jgi:hypothetical protein